MRRVKKILLLEIVSLISGEKTGTFSRVHVSSCIETESVKITLLLHEQSKITKKKQKRNANLFISSVIESFVFSFMILMLLLTMSGLSIKTSKTVVFQQICGY